MLVLIVVVGAKKTVIGVTKSPTVMYQDPWHCEDTSCYNKQCSSTHRLHH